VFLGPVFERFVQRCPLPVLFRGLLEHALPPSVIDEVFEVTAAEQYTGTLLFSSAVELLGLAVCKIRPSVHAAYQAREEPLPVSLGAVYAKLGGVEAAVTAALVRASAQRLRPVLAELGGTGAPLLPGYAVRILDGNYLARTQHRLRELRASRAAALPGMSVVVLDPDARLVCDLFACENGHAQERALLPAVLETVRPGQVWMGDRNYCTTGFVGGLLQRQAHFLIRQHAATVTTEEVTPLRGGGRCATGAVLEQQVRLTNVAGTPAVRRVLLRLDRPTEDGDTELVLLTDLPVTVPAVRVAEVYRERWGIEGVFFHLTQALNGEVETLAFPRAALLGFALALVAGNVLEVVQAGLRAAHGAQAAERVSFYYVAEEIAATYRGMLVAIPEAEWAVWREQPAAAVGAALRELAHRVRLRAYSKHPRGPKKPRPERPRCPRYRHVSTAKLLAGRKPGCRRTPSG
jgi:Transposase DDE domain